MVDETRQGGAVVLEIVTYAIQPDGLSCRADQPSEALEASQVQHQRPRTGVVRVPCKRCPWLRSRVRFTMSRWQAIRERSDPRRRREVEKILKVHANSMFQPREG